MYEFHLKKAKNKLKKYTIYCVQMKRSISFGAAGYQDYTGHKDAERKRLYLARHERNEDWTKSGIMTAGFWSRYLLWNKPTLSESIRDVESRFGIKIIRV